MRGRKPSRVEIAPEDLSALQQMARRQTAPWQHVRRARTLLAGSCGERVQDIAAQLDCHRNTVRQTFSRYQQRGLDGLFDSIERSGRPREISPPAKSANC